MGVFCLREIYEKIYDFLLFISWHHTAGLDYILWVLRTHFYIITGGFLLEAKATPSTCRAGGLFFCHTRRKTCCSWMSQLQQVFFDHSIQEKGSPDLFQMYYEFCSNFFWSLFSINTEMITSVPPRIYFDVGILPYRIAATIIITTGKKFKNRLESVTPIRWMAYIFKK